MNKKDTKKNKQTENKAGQEAKNVEERTER